MLEPAWSRILAGLGLDRLPKGCTFLFQGPSGSGKTILADNLIFEHLESGKNAIFLTLSRSPRSVMESISSLGTFNKQRLFEIDGYSWLTGENISNDRYALANLSNLNDLSIMVSKLLSVVGEGSLFVFDHVSTILNYNAEEHVLRLLHTLIARIREAQDWAIVTLESDIHTQSFYNSVRFFIDCVIDFKIEEIEGVIYRSIRVQRANFPIRDTRWHHFEVEPNGRFVLQPTLFSLGGRKGKIDGNGESEYGKVEI